MNKEEFEFLGITKFHEAGYRGQGIIICSKENIIEGIFDDVFCLEYEKPDEWSRHGTTVMDYIRQVAPEATKWAIETQGTTKNGVLYSKGMDYLQKNAPDILTTSFFKSSDIKEPKKSLYTQLYDKGCFLILSAGNKDEEIEKLAEGDMWKAVGACRFNNGKLKVEKDYAAGPEMDFVSLHNLYSMWDESKHKGTSFSAPLFAGMCALVQCFFLKKTGKKLSHKKMLKFVIDNCLDLEDEGRDHKTGHGLFILPDPANIDISKYCEDYEESGEEDMPKYNTLAEVPEWGKSTVEKLINKGALKGDENGNLNISEELLRTFVIHDRLGIYDLVLSTENSAESAENVAE
ncbi:MAG: S8/S53 family peptidase [Clostridia bacterium]|nr:S8/S53 family peptidase [Clostridia bacterium]